jgi:hypothetical protein
MGAERSTVKTIVMLASLALVLGAGTACFGLFSKKEPAATDPCAGLTGQAKADCESKKAR